MQEIKGLMATPTVRSAGGFRAAVPQLDTTVQKNANEALSNTTKYFALRTRQEKQAEEDMLNARASSMLNEYNLYGKDVLYGKNGAMYQKGTAVVTGVDGESWVSYNQGKLREKRDAILSSVEGDKRLYDKVKAGLEKLDVTFYSTLDAHFGQESHNYVVDQNEIGKSNVLDSVTAGGYTAKHNATLRGTMATLARLAGNDPSDPVYKPAFDRAVRAEMSKAVKNNVILGLDRGDIEGAAASLNSAFRDGAINAVEHAEAKSLIETARQQKRESEAASNVSATIVQLRTPTYVAASVAAPNNGTIDDSLFFAAGIDPDKARADGYGTNKAITQSVNAQLMDGLYKRYGSFECAIAATVVGTDVMDEAVSAALEKGNPLGWQDALSASDKGRVTTAVKRYRNDARSKTSITDEEIGAQVRAMYPDMLPDEAARVAKAAKVNVSTYVEERRLRQTAAAMNVVESLKNGVTVKASDMDVLTAEQRAAVGLIAEKQRIKNPPSDVNMYMLFSDPYELKAMSDADFMLIGQANLSEDDYKEAAQRRDALRGVKDLDKLYVTRDTVKPMVASFMESKNPKYNEDDDGKYVFNRTVDLVRRKVQEAVNANGKEPTKAEIEEIVGRTLIGDRFFVPPGLMKSGEYKSVYSLEFGDLSDTAKDLAKEMAKSMYGDSFPDDASALSAFKEFLLFSTEDLPSNVIAKAKAKYSDKIDIVRKSARDKGKNLTDTAAIRMTLYLLQRDPKYIELLGNRADSKYNSATGVRKSVLYDDEFKGAD